MAKRTLLERIEDADAKAVVDSLTRYEKLLGTPDPYLHPSRNLIGRHSDEELLELMAFRPNTPEGQIAASEMRGRESWRTPARWALGISAMSFALAAAAFIRTL